ncbi:MAG: PAS domain S-box protein [Bacteroidales bacterium]|nr:PAS domain S-box protein [Bacteroidales bacterium]MBN2820969.1 PAS domain S-box protein [Bacteroidales bacterium]
MVSLKYSPQYGDLTELNTERTILEAVGKENLQNLTSELMELLQTSVAIYEKNGDYAYCEFDSAWCRLLDASSRKLCNTVNNKKALSCGKWLCHDDCWKNSAKKAIQTKTSTDINCVGGIKLFAEPVFVDDEVIGTINMGYGNPPSDDKSLHELAEKYSIDFETIKQKALAYNSRPDYIIEIAKKRLKSVAKLIGEIVSRKQLEQKLKERIKELNCISKLSELVETKTSIEDILSELVYIVKQSWKFSDIAEVRITNNGFSSQTDKFRETKWKMISEIKTRQEVKGKIEVVYLKNPTSLTDPFLKEEYNLLQIIAERLGRIIERIDSSKRYEELFNTLYESVIRADKDGVITDANEAAVKLCGYNSKNDLIGRSFTDLYASADTEKNILKNLKQKGGTLQNFEFQLNTKAGDIVPVSGNINMLFQHNGEYLGTLSALRDISEVKQAEQALKESEKKFRTIFEKGLSAIVIADDKGNYLSVNQAAADLFGYSISELLQMNVANLQTTANPNAAEQYKEYLKKGEESGEFSFINKEGEEKTAIYKAVRVEADFNLSMLLDITEQNMAAQELVNIKGKIEKSELRFRTMFSEAPLGIALINSLNGKIYEVNTKFAKIAGRTKEEMTNIDWMSITHPDDIQEDLDNMSLLNAGKISGFKMQKRYIRPDGSFVWINMTIAPVYVEDTLEPRHLCMIENITERKETEQALKNSEAKLKLIVNESPFPVAVVNVNNHKIEYWSKKAKELTGYMPETVTEWYKLAYPDAEYRKQVSERWAPFEEKARVTGEAVNSGEYQIKCKDGSIISCEIYVQFIPGYYVVTLNNITERIKYENNLVKRNREIELLLKGSRLVLESNDFITTAQQIFDYCRELTGAKAGYIALLNENGEENDVLYLEPGGMPCSVNPDLPMPIRGLREIVYKTGKTTFDNNYLQSPHVKYMPKGHMPLRNVMFAPLKQNEKTIGLIGLAEKQNGFNKEDANLVTSFAELVSIALKNSRFIEQIQESELNFKSIVENSTNLFYKHDTNHKVTYISPQVKDVLGCTPEEAMHLWTAFLTDHPINEKGLDKTIKTIQTGKKQGVYNLELMRKDGRKIWVEVREAPILKNGETVEIVGALTDVTDKIRYEDELKNKARELQKTNNNKDQFISILAHDIKNPFGSLLGFSELLAENADTYDRQKIISQAGIINQIAVNTHNLLEDILLWSKATSDNYSMELSNINASNELNTVLEVLIPLASYKQIQIKNEVENTIQLYTDSYILKTVFRNLISNAIKFTNKGGVITIRTQENANEIKFSVADTGIGMKQVAIDKLFKLEHFTSTKGTNQEKGTGFGLRICKELVGKIGGALHVESELGKGSTFAFTLSKNKE